MRKRPCGVEVGDIFRRYGPQYRRHHQLPVNQLRAMRAVESCRTADLGGHVDECDHCGHTRISYNSCRNRHCPKCQFLKKEKWVEARNKDILPIPYYHVVFTLPGELNPLLLRNQKAMYDLLFRSVSETLIELGKDPKHLGARIGFMCMLHTWGQNLMDHPHIHCVVSGGGLAPEDKAWVACRKKFFMSVRVMSVLFKGKFLDYLRRLYVSEKLEFPGGIAHLTEPGSFESFRKKLYHKKWVVYCKPPFNGSKGVLQYLSRYTHRIAIGNRRILNAEDNRVSFRWRDYSDGNKEKVMTLEASEFIRRFLLHILPKRFVKIRYYGLWGSRNRKADIPLCRTLLGDATPKAPEAAKPEAWHVSFLRLTGIDLFVCPSCQKGRMHLMEVLHPSRCNDPPQRMAYA
jgi:hypothetical protein